MQQATSNRQYLATTKGDIHVGEFVVSDICTQGNVDLGKYVIREFVLREIHTQGKLYLGKSVLREFILRGNYTQGNIYIRKSILREICTQGNVYLGNLYLGKSILRENRPSRQQAITDLQDSYFRSLCVFCISDIRFLGQLCGQCVVFEFGFPRSGCFSVAGNECSYVIECLDLWCFRTQKYKKHYSLISYNIRKFRKCCFWFLILRSDPFSPTSFLMGSCTPICWGFV